MPDRSSKAASVQHALQAANERSGNGSGQDVPMKRVDAVSTAPAKLANLISTALLASFPTLKHTVSIGQKV